MRARLTSLALVLTFAAAASWAQDAAKKRVIDLADGGRVVERADGTMVTTTPRAIRCRCRRATS